MGHIRITTEHGAQTHARSQIPHELYSIELFQPCPVVENDLLPAYLRRVMVLDAQALDMRPKRVELSPYALNVHGLHICTLSRASGRPA